MPVGGARVGDGGIAGGGEGDHRADDDVRVVLGAEGRVALAVGLWFGVALWWYNMLSSDK